MARELSPTAAAGTQDLASHLAITKQQATAMRRLIDAQYKNAGWIDKDRIEVLAILGLTTDQDTE